MDNEIATIRRQLQIHMSDMAQLISVVNTDILKDPDNVDYISAARTVGTLSERIIEVCGVVAGLEHARRLFSPGLADRGHSTQIVQKPRVISVQDIMEGRAGHGQTPGGGSIWIFGARPSEDEEAQ